MRQKTKFVSSVKRGPRGTPESARKGWVTRRANLAAKAPNKAADENKVVHVAFYPDALSEQDDVLVSRLKNMRANLVAEIERKNHEVLLIDRILNELVP